MGSVHYSDNESKLFGWLALTDEQFADKVERGVEDLKQRRQIYFLKLFGLIALGFAFIISVFAGSIGFIWWLIEFAYSRHIFGPGLALLAFPPAVAIYLIVMSLWPRIAKLEGIRIKRQEAPALFEVVDDFCKKLTTSVHEVVITDNFNAHVSQTPFFGLPFLHRNSLVLGLPHLASLTPDQFKSVLAHELGHLSGNHGRCNAQIYSLRYRWRDIVVSTREDSPIVYLVFYPFYLWLFSRFDAYSMALMREHETKADESAAALTSGNAVASALVSSEIKGFQWANLVWPEIFRQARIRSATPENIYELALEPLRMVELEIEECQSLVERILRKKTNYSDTHPSIAERIAHTGVGASVEELASVLRTQIEVGGTAAEVFLEGTYEILKNKLSMQWSWRNAEAWAERHKYLIDLESRLAELEKLKSSGSVLSRAEWGELIDCISELNGPDTCHTLWTELLEKFPDDPVANQQIGLALIGQDDEEGIAYLEKAMNTNLALTGECLEAIRSFLVERDRSSEFSKYDEITMAYLKEQDLARAEREGASGNDELYEHDFNEEFMDHLRKELLAFNGIQYAYLAYKVVHHRRESPYLVLGLSPRPGTEMDMHQVGTILLSSLDMPYGFCVVVFDNTNQRLKEKFLAIPNSYFYRN